MATGLGTVNKADAGGIRVRTIRRYLWREIASASLFVLFALLALFLFFDMVAQLDEIGQRGFRFRDALFYVALTFRRARTS